MASNFKNILIGLGILLLISALTLFFVYDPSEVSLFPPCPFLYLTGFYCPGCGSQRAIHDLLHGDLVGGLDHNLMIGLLLLVLGYQMIHWVLTRYSNRPIKNILHHPYATNTILALVIAFWVLRNISISPFNVLAP